MKIEHRKLEGDVRIVDDLDLHGMITGSATVAPGRQLELHGVVCEDLILEEGSTVNLYGTVSGSVYNRGGQLNVYGVITGPLQRVAGRNVIDPDAIIRGGTF
jgi:hypothetical protein